MTKLKSPLLSFSAHGTLGDVLVYFDRHGKNYVRSKPKDPVSLSLAQGLLRDCFVSAAISAHSLTEGQKDAYANLAPNSAFCPWWNNFIGQYIKDNYEGPDVATTFIKSLQVPICTLDDGAYTQDTLIDSVNVSYTVPIFLGCSAPNDDSRNSHCICLVTNSTNIRLARAPDPKLGVVLCSVMVVEFEPDFIKSLQVKNISISGADTEGTESIDAVNLSKSIIFPCGKRSFSDVGFTQFNSYVDFLNNTTLRARRFVGGSMHDSRVCVVEFI